MTVGLDLLHPQWLAAAWLREAGEPRPAIDVLRSDQPLSAELRQELARWIARGSKRRRGSKVPRDPWIEYPPALATSFNLARTPREERAWMLFIAFLSTAAGLRAMLAEPSGERGRPGTLDGAAIAQVARKTGVTKRTARKWSKQFFPNGLLAYCDRYELR